MDEQSGPRDHWITKRIDSRMSVLFQNLCNRIKEDVEEMNRQVVAIWKDSQNTFTYSSEIRLATFSCIPSPDRLTVEAKLQSSYTIQVSCALESAQITVDTLTLQYGKTSGPTPLFTIESVQWDKKHQTYLPRIAGECCVVEDLSRRVLEPLFFPSKS